MFFLVTVLILSCQAPEPATQFSVDASPILPGAYRKLPLGAVKPEGWLKDQLVSQASGLSGHLDEFWPDMMYSAWKGGEGEAWERGPYYLDGLLPLAYLLDNQRLIAKTQLWVEHMIDSQHPDGWFGPEANTDRWPLAIAMKVLAQYYEATQDERALTLIRNFFDWLATHEPDWPDAEWRGVRAMEHAVSGYWLYRQHPDPNILKTIHTIHHNSFDWTQYFIDFPWNSEAWMQGDIPHEWDAKGKTAHVVNVAMAIKYPGLWYQQSKDARFKDAVLQGLDQLDAHHGQVGGRFSGDEHLAGKHPTQGTELCAVVEFMYSLEQLMEVFGDVDIADRLEALAYNSLPGSMTPDCWAHQYDQQANQVLVSEAERAWSSNSTSANIYGLMPNYPCCLANMHQGWPKFVQSMWMATPDSGLAVVAYGPNKLETLVRGERTVHILQKTEYPFDGNVRLELQPESETEFPLSFRIPAWAEGASMLINNERFFPEAGSMYRIERRWKAGDIVNIHFPMRLRAEYRQHNALSLLRGPLYFSLRIAKEYKKINLTGEHIQSINYLGSTDWEIHPTSAWNMALIIDPDHSFVEAEIIRHPIRQLPFADQGEPVFLSGENAYTFWDHPAPVVIKMEATQLSQWKLVEHSAGEVPPSPVQIREKTQIVELVPYGASRLRITEFPWAQKR
ncbi:MAG: beta-L-arabinofuranosidase domain-containing protein [Bacteroidota bacterium]